MSALLPGDLPALRRVPAPLLHFTLAFIGNVPEHRLAAASDAVRAAAAGVASFNVALDGIGRFPERGQPNVVWLRAGEGASDLERLGLRVRDALRRHGVPFDGKPFRPHVTLARVQRDIAPTIASDLVAALATLAPPALRFRADALHVVESTLSPKGPRYSSVQAVPLGPAERLGEGSDDDAGHPGRDGPRDVGSRVPQAPRQRAERRPRVVRPDR